MARAQTLTKLPLDEWARIIGISPLHFNQLYVAPVTICEQPWMQFAHQAVNRVGREDIALAVAKAEADIERQLHYRLLPTWEVDEWRPTVRPWRKELFNLRSLDIRGMQQIVFTNWKHFISGGVRAQTLIEAGAAIAYSDVDNDGYWETTTVTVTVAAGQDPCELRIYVPVSNAMVQTGGEDQWEIRPINVAITGTTATILFRREQAVKPELQLDLVPPADDSHLRGLEGSPAGDSNFLNTVDVYRVYNDPQQQATFLWEPFSACGCGTGCELCAFTAQTGCLMQREDPRIGAVSYRPGAWNADDESFDSAVWALGRQPDLTRLWYRAGLRNRSLACPTRTMDPEWAQIVAYYAASLLDRPVCECNNVHAWIEHWRQDLAANLENVSFQVSPEDLNNPFGTRRGAIFAWRRVRQEGGVAEAVLA
jgi:hypothetical protein